jgi:hypothetical protein
VVPVRFRGADGTVQDAVSSMRCYPDDDPPIAGGREIWGFPERWCMLYWRGGCTGVNEFGVKWSRLIVEVVAIDQ